MSRRGTSRPVTTWLLFVAALSSSGCRSERITARDADTVLADSGATYFPGATWRRASAGAAGFERAAIVRLAQDIDRGRYGAIDGVVLVRYGHVVLEHYANGWRPVQPHTLQSVTKSVTSLLYGIARAQHAAAADLDRPLLDILARYDGIANVDGNKRALTVRHLLSMRTSMDFWEQPYPGSPLDQLNRSSGDWVRFVLDRRMTGAPGATWAYNSGAAIVTCGVIREVTTEPVDGFAHRMLFAPMGITSESWARSPYDGLPHCGGGLYLPLTDIARIGYLVLRHGRWNDRQLVDSAWIVESTQPMSRGDPVFFSSYGSAYGYFWWLFPYPAAEIGVIAASGSGGQWLFVVPKLDLVVAVVASNGNGLDLLYDGVLPAVQRIP